MSLTAQLAQEQIGALPIRIDRFMVAAGVNWFRRFSL